MCARQDTAWSVAVPFTLGYPIWLSELTLPDWRHGRRRLPEAAPAQHWIVPPGRPCGDRAPGPHPRYMTDAWRRAAVHALRRVFAAGWGGGVGAAGWDAAVAPAERRGYPSPTAGAILTAWLAGHDRVPGGERLSGDQLRLPAVRALGQVADDRDPVQRAPRAEVLEVARREVGAGGEIVGVFLAGNRGVFRAARITGWYSRASMSSSWRARAWLAR